MSIITRHVKLYLRRVRLNSGGYDNTGTYFGVGSPLYEYFDDGDITEYIRAHDREHAKERVTASLRTHGLSVKFYR